MTTSMTDDNTRRITISLPPYLYTALKSDPEISGNLSAFITQVLKSALASKTKTTNSPLDFFNSFSSKNKLSKSQASKIIASRYKGLQI